jgi:branched-chain amino acid transport system substrate-binding protein
LANLDSKRTNLVVLISRTKFILAISIATSILLSACSNAAPQVVRVAINLPLALGVGQDMLNAMQLALNEANGKAGNIPVELRTLNSSDPAGNPVSVDLAVSTTKDAIADSSVVAYIGPATSDQTRATAPLLNNASITQVSPAASWPGLTKPGFNPGEPGIYYPTGQRHFFRLVPSDDVQGLIATHWIAGRRFLTCPTSIQRASCWRSASPLALPI